MRSERGRLAVARYSAVAAVVGAALVLLPALERPAMAQAGAPPPSPLPPPHTAAPPPPPPSGQPPPPPQGSPWYPSAGSGWNSQQPVAPFNPVTAMMEGAADGEADSSGALWFFAGCVLGVWGVVIGYVVDPSPPATRLMGKSPEYVMTYTAAYKTAGKSAQGKQALIGCGVGAVVSVALYLVIVFAIIRGSSVQ